MHDIPACVLLLFSISALATLLYAASVIDDDEIGWARFTGPFLVLYVFFMFLACVSCTPIALYYCTRHTENEDVRKRRLKASVPAVVFAALFIALAIIFLALLSADIDAALDSPGGAASVNWTAPFVIATIGTVGVVVYGAARMSAGEGNETLSLNDLWCTNAMEETHRENGAPLCFGGSDALDNAETASGKWTRRYHVSLLVALSFAAFGFVAAAPTLNSGSNINSALWAFYIATFISFASGLILFIVRLRASVVTTTRQTVMVGLATGFSLFAFIFAIQLNETYNSAHVLFITLYVAFAGVIAAMVILTADVEDVAEFRREKTYATIDDSAQRGEQVSANWEQL